MTKPFSYKVYLAMADAVRAHEKQRRKSNSGIPYAAHPLQVALEVSRIEDDEDVVIAAILHDTLEDTEMTGQEISAKYGKRVLEIVRSVSEDKDRTASLQEKKRTWHARKAQMIERLRLLPFEAQLIALADDLQNLRCTVEDLKSGGLSPDSPEFSAPLATRAGLYRYRCRLWLESPAVAKCRPWLDFYRDLLEELDGLLASRGVEAVPFCP